MTAGARHNLPGASWYALNTETLEGWGSKRLARSLHRPTGTNGIGCALIAGVRFARVLGGPDLRKRLSKPCLHGRIESLGYQPYREDHLLQHDRRIHHEHSG